MKMPVHNFDEHFAEYVSEWMKAHQSEYSNFDEMEEDMPRVYMNFLNTRAKWLGNVTPGAYFTQFEDPKVLVDWMNQYCAERVPLPELLREMDSTMPKMLYINWQLDREEKDDMKDKALESLTAMGETVVQPILQNLNLACPAGQEALMEVLSNFPGDDRIFRLAIRLFEEKKERRALFAGYLAKLGDDRALPALISAAQEPGLPYLTFIEVRNAIEALGGVCPEREYDDDPEYEALRQMDLT